MNGVPDLELRSRTGGSVAFAVRELGDRRAVVVEIAGEDRGALRPADGENLAIAARTARDQRLPLVCFVESSGAAIDDTGPGDRGAMDCLALESTFNEGSYNCLFRPTAYSEFNSQQFRKQFELLGIRTAGNC